MFGLLFWCKSRPSPSQSLRISYRRVIRRKKSRDEKLTKRLILHVGTHRTGSTSLQQFLVDHRTELSARGYALYRGLYRERNHIEIYLAALRQERDSFGKLGAFAGVDFGEAFRRDLAQRIQSFVREQAEPSIILSTEGLSLLRYSDELDALKSILGCDSVRTTVVVYLRNPSDFLRSYTQQLLKKRGRTPSTDPGSALYVRQDSWLVDFDSLLRVYRDAFGADAVHVIDYDECLRLDGNVIPAFLRVLGLGDLGGADLAPYFLNRSFSR